MNESRWNSRKLALCLLAIVAGTALCWLGKLDGPTWADAVVWLAGIYCSGNVGAEWVRRLPT